MNFIKIQHFWNTWNKSLKYIKKVSGTRKKKQAKLLATWKNCYFIWNKIFTSSRDKFRSSFASNKWLLEQGIGGGGGGDDDNDVGGILRDIKTIALTVTKVMKRWTIIVHWFDKQKNTKMTAVSKLKLCQCTHIYIEIFHFRQKQFRSIGC